MFNRLEKIVLISLQLVLIFQAVNFPIFDYLFYDPLLHLIHISK